MHFNLIPNEQARGDSGKEKVHETIFGRNLKRYKT